MFGIYTARTFSTEVRTDHNMLQRCCSVRKGVCEMRFFGRKKKEPETIKITGIQLCTLVKKLEVQVKKEVEEKPYITGPEIIFEFHGHVHSAGVKYDKKRAKKEEIEKTDFPIQEYMTVYLDKQLFHSAEEMCFHGVLEGIPIANITQGILTYPKYRSLLPE